MPQAKENNCGFQAYFKTHGRMHGACMRDRIGSGVDEDCKDVEGGYVTNEAGRQAIDSEARNRTDPRLLRTTFPRRERLLQRECLKRRAAPAFNPHGPTSTRTTLRIQSAGVEPSATAAAAHDDLIANSVSGAAARCDKPGTPTHSVRRRSSHQWNSARGRRGARPAWGKAGVTSERSG